MQRVVIDKKSFDAAQAIQDMLLDHIVAVTEVEYFESSQKRAGTDFFVMSHVRASELGGQSGVIEVARQYGARTVLIVDEQAPEYSVTTELNGKIACIALGQQLDCEYAILLLCALLHGTRRAIVRDQNVKDLFKMSERVAEADVSVFINGPTGSGKEVMAKYIHQRSRRSDGEFVAINCAAIPENMLEAMLFGHEKGAFTGASTTNVGLIRAAEGGTLLLDEISEMSMTLQAKLLRAIQELAITPVGGNRQIEVDIRILATSNRNMQAECVAGRFREDLFYRLNVFPLNTISVADRALDIVPICTFLMRRHCNEISNIPWLTDGAVEKLTSYSWPGNVRELENVLQRALVLAMDNKITAADIVTDDVIHNMNRQPLTSDSLQNVAVG